ncbi:MAG: hypothetical protein Q9181_004728 [Wetmoreana brouardii]
MNNEVISKMADLSLEPTVGTTTAAPSTAPNPFSMDIQKMSKKDIIKASGLTTIDDPAKDLPNEPFKGTLYEKIKQLMDALRMKEPPPWIIPILQKDPRPECKDAADRFGIETLYDKPGGWKGKKKDLKVAMKEKDFYSDTDSDDEAGDDEGEDVAAADDGEEMEMGELGKGLDEEDAAYFTDGVQSEDNDDEAENEDEEQVFVDDMD